jgi:hypothetical protein
MGLVRVTLPPPTPSLFSCCVGPVSTQIGPYYEHIVQYMITY